MVCKSAANTYGWGYDFHPFLGYKKLPVEDPYQKVFPFSIEEQKKLIAVLPDHWKPYFKFAFSTGLRQGEQIALRPSDIDWENRVLKIQRALTRGESGKPVLGKTKNQYSLRTINLLPVMLDSLLEQKKILTHLDSFEYFFVRKQVRGYIQAILEEGFGFLLFERLVLKSAICVKQDIVSQRMP